jgi:two-component system, NtrC family, response regulator HydG
MSTTLAGRSAALRAFAHEIDRVARSAAKILITGESGLETETVARLIHEHSGRHGPFVPVHCASISDAWLSKLFGCWRGRRTGVHPDRRGWLYHAQGGTLFLNEVGELSPPMQARLLEFLETDDRPRAGVRAAGGDIRVISATTRNLFPRVAESAFRDDLYYRLNVIQLVLPPLAERLDDISTYRRLPDLQRLTAPGSVGASLVTH